MPKLKPELNVNNNAIGLPRHWTDVYMHWSAKPDEYIEMRELANAVTAKVPTVEELQNLMQAAVYQTLYESNWD